MNAAGRREGQRDHEFKDGSKVWDKDRLILEMACKLSSIAGIYRLVQKGRY
jgi:hypothetical protein